MAPYLKKKFKSSCIAFVSFFFSIQAYFDYGCFCIHLQQPLYFNQGSKPVPGAQGWNSPLIRTPLQAPHKVAHTSI